MLEASAKQRVDGATEDEDKDDDEEAEKSL